ncbi:MAG: 2-oxo acid dehydrogenase subunit E2 [Planctomycetes bacterium]|nr:2-oxo acid dehydrogenase subunit E2 [Planctomycetota bacterium]
MASDIRMPQMGESIAEGTLTRWFKKPGDRVKRDEPLFEISTDKVDAEIPSPADGVLEEILVAEGTTVEVNTVVGRIGDGGAKPAPAVAATAARVAAAAPRAATTAAPHAATAAHATPATDLDDADGVEDGADSGKATRSSPLVRRIAREHGITDLSRVPGTGVGGRVTKQDIANYVAGVKPEAGAPVASAAGVRAAAPPATPASAAPAAPPRGAAPTRQPAAPAPGGAHAGAIEALPILRLSRENARVEPLSIMRRKIAEHMVLSRRISAHVHSVFEIDVDQIAKLRERRKADFQTRHGVNLTYMAFFMKATVDTLLNFPYVNCSLDGTDIILHNGVNLGIAVALDAGLIVPVVKNAHELSLVGLQKRVTDLATRARSKQLVPDEVQGGTFTITNPGAFGNEFGIPIINQPQVAILGIGGVKKRAVVVEGDAIAVRSTVYMCLSYDHRIVDGALADQFMAKLKDSLQNWDPATLE